MRFVVFVAAFAILMISIGFSNENPILRQQTLENERSTKVKELTTNPVNLENRQSLEEILQAANKVIDEKLSSDACLRQRAEKFKEFVQEWLKDTDLKELNKGYPLVTENLNIALERYKKERPLCKGNLGSVGDLTNTLQAAAPHEQNMSIGGYFKGEHFRNFSSSTSNGKIWPPFPGQN